MLYLHAYGLAFLELTFVIVTLMLLHSLRPVIGNIAFYLSLGAVLVFAQFVTAGGMKISMAFPGLHIDIGPTIFFTPLMAALLITYIVDGTLEAQRLILGIMAMVGVFFYFSLLSEQQCNFPGYELYPYMPKSFFGPLFQSGRNFMLASLLSLLVVFLVLPIVYQLMRNRRARISVSVFGALVFTEVLDAFFFELVTNYPTEDWWEGLRHSYLTRAIAMIWVSALTTIYLALVGAEKVRDQDERNPLDIFTAFLGSHGQARRLQANVREWEGRYRMVVENTNDLIFLVAKSGMILDANRMAIQTLGYSIEELSRMPIETMIKSSDANLFHWPDIWTTLFPENTDAESANTNISGHEWQMQTKQGMVLIFDASMSGLRIQKSEATLLVARNITLRKELERERESLQSQLIQSQRMEAVGKLAGGIAHDFNNLLHAIQGSLDMLDTVVTTNRKARELTSNITSAVGRAANLTGQLLGFARGGKYTVVPIDIGKLIRLTEDLFRPMLGKKTVLKVVLHPDPMIVEGDFTQLEQVLLNILLNALEALPEKTGMIVVRAEPATEHTPGWEKGAVAVAEAMDRSADDKTTRGESGSGPIGDGKPRPRPKSGMEERAKTVAENPLLQAHKFVAIRIRDNGCGMTPEVQARIFEPFYSVNKSKGIGMGLAMVYGCVQNHHGWVHVDSEEGKGSEFVIFLPKA